MPVTKCPNGKYRIGDGECIYTSRKKALDAYRAYLAKHPEKNKSEIKDVEAQIAHELEKEQAALEKFRQRFSK